MVQGTVELTRDIALEAASNLAAGLTFCCAPGGVGLRRGATAQPDQGDGVDRAVERPVATAIEPMTHRAPAAGLERTGPRQRSERSVAAAPSRMGKAHHDLRGGDRSDAGAINQPGREILHDV